MNWTEESVRGFVTDAGTLRDGQKLTQSGKYGAVGQNAASAWGQVQGSAKEPYRVVIDFGDLATKCSCPSRKFPCKHAAGLMLLLAQNKVAADNSPPEWVSTWLEGRRAKRVSEPAPAAKSDPAAQSKREAQRLKKVAAGMDELRLFLEDLARHGLGDPRIKSYEFWDRIARRMVDAQMTPVARRLRALGGKPFQRRNDWASQLADEVGRLYALIEAYSRLESLPEPLMHDVRAAVGFTVRQEDVLVSQPSVRDQWQIVGQMTEKVEQILERRTWLYGLNTQRWALLLDFAHRSSPFSAIYPLGHRFDGELAYYPSAFPQRAALKQIHGAFRPNTGLDAFCCVHLEQILSCYAEALAANPFLDRVPAGVPRAVPSRVGLVEPSGHVLPLSSLPNAQWMQAVSGGDWLPIFGEWDGVNFSMLTLVTTEGWIPARSA
jgi:hypothetical protein